LNKLVRSFNVEFDGKDNDFAWFPVWLLIMHPQLADRFQGTQPGANTAVERCARLILNLLALKPQGRHADLVGGRKKLRDAHHGLFERYMRTRQ
jgi:hypothetical protein